MSLLQERLNSLFKMSPHIKFVDIDVYGNVTYKDRKGDKTYPKVHYGFNILAQKAGYQFPVIFERGKEYL